MLDKYERQIEKCYERLKYTLNRSSGILLVETDEELLWLVYEELDIDVPSDLCDENLNGMVERNYIYPEIAETITRLRAMMIELMRKRLDASDIRSSEEWQNVVAEAQNVLRTLYI